MTDVYRFLQRATIVKIDGKLARKRWDLFREMNGYKAGRPLLTQPDENMKLNKGKKVGSINYGLALAQSTLSGHNVCRWSTPSCRSGCVGSAGNGRFSSVVEARALKVRWLLADPSAFISLLAHEIDQAYAKHGDALAVRLNTFSDIPWEELAPWLFSERPQVIFYDYTKAWHRTPPANYHLTLSASERTENGTVVAAVEEGHNVAVVFKISRSKPLPETWQGVSVIDGDLNDARHLDPRGVVVGLRAKGSMRKQEVGMARNVAA